MPYNSLNSNSSKLNLYFYLFLSSTLRGWRLICGYLCSDLSWIWKQRDIADWRKIITFNWKKQVFERNSIFVKLKCLGYKSINLLARIRNVDTKISSFFDKKWKPLFTSTTSDHWNIKKFFSIFFLWSVCHIIQNSCFCDSLIRRILIQVRPWDWSNLSPSSNCAFFQSRIFYSHHSITTWSDIILSKP